MPAVERPLRGARRPRGLVLVALGAGCCLLAGCPRAPVPAQPSAAAAGELPPRIRTATLESLSANGYTGATGEALTGGGVTTHLPKRAWPGLNLWSSGHAPVALVTDMAGRELHRWRWRPPARERSRYMRSRRSYWSRVRALPNGDLIGLFANRSLVRLDHRSRLLWAHFGAHVDFTLLPGGDVLVLSGDGTLLWLSAAGEPRRRLSLDECCSELGAGADATGLRRAGSELLVLALAEPPAVAALDPARGEIVWRHRQPAARQLGDALDGGRLLLFEPGARAARVVEIEPSEPEPRWHYGGSGDHALFGPRRGDARRLPNGNTLIGESDRGRAREVDPRGRVVWAYESPFGMGPAGAYRAALLDLQRLPADFFAQGVE